MLGLILQVDAGGWQGWRSDAQRMGVDMQLPRAGCLKLRELYWRLLLPLCSTGSLEEEQRLYSEFAALMQRDSSYALIREMRCKRSANRCQLGAPFASLQTQCCSVRKRLWRVALALRQRALRSASRAA